MFYKTKLLSVNREVFKKTGKKIEKKRKEKNQDVLNS